jgi:adenylate cyclase
MIEYWEKAIDLYEGGKFKEAGGIFLSLVKHKPADTVAELYLERCKEYLKIPPPPDWDAVRNLTEK